MPEESSRMEEDLSRSQEEIHQLREDVATLKSLLYNLASPAPNANTLHMCVSLRELSWSLSRMLMNIRCRHGMPAEQEDADLTVTKVGRSLYWFWHTRP